MHEEALQVVNMLQDQLAMLAKAIVSAVNDGKVSAWEGMAIGMRGMSLASYIMSVLLTMPPGLRGDILYVLENGEFVLNK